ncbi:hypothetical protein [Flavobacterium hydatis]|uniref:Uncharacterized protein n=1 Tax=Flavobacterium hydatis TaxID=991 RepID=A0A086A379_FLAHY|nr:hypothetical protein [Flavobacterium hydatis]KFF11143.1 hypothetical protein IW20_19555 [Flavobacterium hydatis]OXA97801.1 hypothetical protein B0A62_02795 [Flavobacterium hydatis]
MKYYQIDVSAEPKIIGVNNGIHQIEIAKKSMQEDITFKEFLSFFSTQNADFWKRQNEIKNLKIPVIKAKLLKKAKVTDIMGYTENISFLNGVYSEKYINILKAFNIGSYTTFEVAIDSVIEKYYMLFIETVCLDQINFEKSILYTGFKPRNYNVQYHNINSYEEFKEFIKQKPIYDFERISIPKESLGKDVVKIQASGKPFYSEKLIDFLLDCGITGLQVNYNNSIELDFY